MMCVVLNVFACFFCYEHKINPLGYLSFVKVSDFFFYSRGGGTRAKQILKKKAR